MTHKLTGPALAAILLAATPAAAHVTATPTEAPAGTKVTVTLRVGHGCEGSPTTAIRVELPLSAGWVNPESKADWDQVIQPGQGPDGRLRTVEVTWKAHRPVATPETFAITFDAPSTAQTLYFPVIQTCQTGEAHWTQIPAEAAMTGLEHPAPFLTLTPAVAASGQPQ
ncbi:MAG: nuclear export factor [Caulobacter sp.]|nr:nuclear export factor [Caulobacter sp.]